MQLLASEQSNTAVSAALALIICFSALGEATVCNHLAIAVIGLLPALVGRKVSTSACGSSF